MTMAERVRVEAGAEHLHALGARAVAELLIALTARVGGGAALVDLLTEYRRITPVMVRAAGADRRPRCIPRVVPSQRGVA